MNIAAPARLAMLVAVCLFSGMLQAADDVILRTAISPAQPWVGQKVSLYVDVLAKDNWAQINKVRAVDINGAYLLKLESQGTRLNETIQGHSYSGQRYEILLFPQRDGKIVVPAVPVDVEVKTWGTTSKTKLQRLRTPQTEFIVRTPPGADDVRGLISTTEFTLTQSWQPDENSLQQGDAIKRTIIMESADVSGMAFAPLQHEAINGLASYPGEPLVEDSFNRGELRGKRIETVTYVVERSGDIDIPEHVFTWWNIETNQLQQSTLAGRRLSIPAGNIAQASVAAVLQSNKAMALGLLILVLVITGLLALRWRAWRTARTNTEAYAFKQVRRALRTREPRIVLRDVMRWLDCICGEGQPARFDSFCASYADAGLLQNYRHLIQAMSADSHIDWSALSAGLKAARKRWRLAQQVQRRVAAVLPDLNQAANRHNG